MVKVFIASGYNSYTHKTLTRAFLAPSEADEFLNGLTNPTLQIFTDKSYIALLNTFLK